MAKDKNIKTMKITKPSAMEYYVSVDTSKNRQAFVKRTERLIRGSIEYRDYIQFLKENVDMNHCAFFQNISNEKGKSNGKVKIEVHHEPFTLYEYVDVVLNKYQDEGLPINDLLIADEVLKLHYDNQIGLIPLSKTMHQIVHKSSKIFIPLNMCYGEFSKFMEEYGNYVPDGMYEKLERKIDQTNNLTEESFDALKKEFTYLEVNGFDELDKIESSRESVA